MMIPGRVLIVDDMKGDVDDLLNEFQRRGEHVTYSGIVLENEYCDNVRLLIMDYYLIEEDEKQSLNAMTTILNEISKKSTFFMTVIWSGKVTIDNAENYRQKIITSYRDRFDVNVPGVLLLPIDKGSLRYSQLVNKIESEIYNYPDLNLIYEIEKIINTSKDTVLNKVCDIGNWSNLVRNLKIEYDLSSIKRQILVIYLNIVKRGLSYTDGYSCCLNHMIEKTEPLNIEDFGKVYASQYYYEVGKSEQIGTGDILYNGKADKYFIIITPECDITNDKHTKTKMIEAVRIDHAKLSDPAYLESIVKDISAFIAIKKKNAIDAIMYGNGIKTNYFILHFLQDYSTKEFYHLVCDFHNVKSLKKAKKVSDLKGYKRVCRIDSPLINKFIQQYASHCSRFGAMKLPEGITNAINQVTA
jgi:hypothetical protein